MTVVGGLQILGMRAAVHVDDTEGMRTSDIEDVQPAQLFELDELHAVRRAELTGQPGCLAPRVRLELLGLAVVVQGLRPGLEADLLERSGRIVDAEHRRPYALLIRCGTLQENSALVVAGRRALRLIALTLLRESGVRQRGAQGDGTCKNR